MQSSTSTGTIDPATGICVCRSRRDGVLKCAPRITAIDAAVSAPARRPRCSVNLMRHTSVL